MSDDKDFKFDFERLTVYQRSLDFVHNIFDLYKKLPREFKHTLGDNLVRAGASIANNIAEGSGKRSKKEKTRYYSTSLDSARECISVFNILFREQLLEKDTYISLRFEGKDITNMLFGLLNSLNNTVNCKQ